MPNYLLEEPIKRSGTLAQAIENGVEAMEENAEVCTTIREHVKHFLSQHFTCSMNDGLPKEESLKALYERITR
jgi:hypothetical protein